MFHSAALRLTVWYLGIIMAISLIFSGLLYKVSLNDLNQNVNRQIGYFGNFLGQDDFDNYTSLRLRQLVQDKHHLRDNLIIFNLFVLAGGGAASYWLARRTLVPIEAALESQSRFAADASHELRTPLAAIQTENEVSLRNPALTKKQAVQLLRSNLEEVAKLKSLSEGLLRLASSSGQAISHESVVLKDVFDKAVDRLAKAAELKKIKISSQSRNLKVRGEADSLSELFVILLDNAIKYSSPRSTVRIGASQHHRLVQVKVEDTGAGITPADLPRIFERFYQADASRSKQQSSGYGLGLAIAHKITSAHNGHIEVKSTFGKGSTFIVYLPSA